MRDGGGGSQPECRRGDSRRVSRRARHAQRRRDGAGAQKSSWRRAARCSRSASSTSRSAITSAADPERPRRTRARRAHGSAPAGGEVLRARIAAGRARRQHESARLRLEPRANIFFDHSPAFRLLPDAELKGVKAVAWIDSPAPLQSGWAWGQQYLDQAVDIVDAPLGKGHCRPVRTRDRLARPAPRHLQVPVQRDLRSLGQVGRVGRVGRVGKKGAPAAMPSRGQANPRLSIRVSSPRGWGPRPLKNAAPAAILSRGHGNPRRGIGVSSPRGWGPAASEEKYTSDSMVGTSGLTPHPCL